MARMIERPLSGQPIPDGWFGQLYDWIASMEVAGDGKTCTVTSNGTRQCISVMVSGMSGNGTPGGRFGVNITGSTNVISNLMPGTGAVLTDIGGGTCRIDVSGGTGGASGYNGPFSVSVNGNSIHVNAGSIVSSGLHGAASMVNVPEATLTAPTSSTYALYLLYYFDGRTMTAQYSYTNSMPTYSFGYSWRIGGYSGGAWHQEQYGDVLQIDDVFPHFGNYTSLGSGLENGKIYRFPVAGWLVGATTMMSDAGHFRLYCGGETSGGTLNPSTFEVQGASWGSNMPLVYQKEDLELKRKFINFCIPVHAGCNIMLEWYVGAGGEWWEQPFSGGAANIFIPCRFIN